MGGNITFGDVKADRIDLKQIDRSDLVTTLTTSLMLIDKAFKQAAGTALWPEKINHYLSGSTTALFDKSVKDEAFIKVKPSVGDIDIQFDERLSDHLVMFLIKHKNAKIGDLTLIDMKSSVDTYITLWRSTKFKINIQIDFETAAFKGKKPTEWAKFSRSSHWDDMSKGIKGLAHKYIIRAIVGADRNEIMIRAKSKRAKDKITVDAEHAFSLKGLRQKLKPALDDKGKHIYQDGRPVYDALEAKDSTFITDFDIIFQAMYGRDMTAADKREMQSFVGIVGLTKKYMKGPAREKVVDRYADLLWGPAAQMIYARNTQQDFDEKTVIFSTLTQELGVNPNKYQSLKKAYYKRYNLEI